MDLKQEAKMLKNHNERIIKGKEREEQQKKKKQEEEKRLLLKQ